VNATRLAKLLADTPAKIDAWRGQARQLTQLLVPARIEGKVSEELHVTIEQTCTAIYSEIETCSAVTKELSETSLAAAAELAPINDALRLILLEVTELSTELYAVGSRHSQAPDLAIS
jgi:hypothetical protein